MLIHITEELFVQAVSILLQFPSHKSSIPKTTDNRFVCRSQFSNFRPPLVEFPRLQMQRYRRLYHSSRCLFNSEFKPSVDLPRPLSAEPVIHPIGQTYPAIVSLQHTGPKVPPQKWQRESLLETATKRAGGKLRRGKLSVLGAPKKTIAERELLSKGRVVTIPIPLPRTLPQLVQGLQFNGRCCTLCNWAYPVVVQCR